MSYEHWFRSGNFYQQEHTAQVLGWLQDPAKLTQDQISYYDKSAQELITEAQQLIEDLGQYREALAARYGELETALYTRTLKLERHPACSWSRKGVTYSITITRSYEDHTEAEELRETYIGKDRRTALARYEELKKQYPGIESVKDIEKRSWER